jgi:hypothetical protein
MDYPAIGDEIFLKKQTYFVKEVDYNKKVIYVFNESEEYEEMTLDQYQHLKCEKCKR